MPPSTLVTAESPAASPGAPASAGTTLCLLDAFHLSCDGETVGLPASAQRLLAFVALHERPLLRAYVAGTLWPDVPDERAAASLRSSLWRLHRAGHRLIDATATQVALAPEVGVDYRVALETARRLLRGDSSEVERAADARLDGELLPDWYDDWVIFERERLRQLGLRALETLADRLVAENRLAEALEVALAAVRGEPLRESAHRALIRVHLAEGNGGEALRQYDLCCRLLRDRLGLEPSPQLVALLQPLTH